MDRSFATRTRPLSAIALAVTAALGTTVGAAGPAQAAPDYPSWDEVEAARADEQQAREKVAEIEGILASLRTAAEDAGRSAMQAAERYNMALDALDAATARAEQLEKSAEQATARAEQSAHRAGAMIAQFARTGGGDVAVGLLFDDSRDGDLLARLGALSKLTEQSATVYERAVADRNLARSLTQEARAAERERVKLFTESKQVLAYAQSAVITAEDRVLEQQEASDQLYAQLASLKGTSAQLEREFAEGLQSVPTPQSPRLPTLPTLPTQPRPSGPAPDGGPVEPGHGPADPEPTRPAPAPAPANPQPAEPEPIPSREPEPEPSAPPSNSVPSTPAPAPTAPEPNQSKVDTAIAFAKSQLGDPYMLGGTGNPGWDCSGLTKYSYNAAGVYIGSHSATNQYFTMKGQGRLVPLAQMKAGDLLWFTSSGGRDFYHVALYIGGGQMIEAPYPGQNVRIVAVRYGDLWPEAGRPTG